MQIAKPRSAIVAWGCIVKSKVIVALFGLLSPVLFGAAANAAIVPDTTDVVSYKGTVVVNFFPGPSSVGDVIESGPVFNTSQVEVLISGLTIEFKFLTQFSGSALGAHYADIFLASDPLNPDSFDYALALGYQASFGGLAAGLHAISPGDYQTSIDRWSTVSGATYGGQYVSPSDSLSYDAPTVVTGGALQAGWTITANQGPSGDGTYPYLLDITMTALNKSTFLSAFPNSGFGAFWGTGDCANDAIYFTASLPPTTQGTPEPATLAMMGSLLGLGVLRRRFAKR